MNIARENYVRSPRTASRGIHQGAAIVFFAYIGFDAISTAAEETRDPQRNLPIGILGGLAICTVIYVVVGAVLTGMVPYDRTRRGRPACASPRRLRATQTRRLDRGARRRRSRWPPCCWSSSTVSRASSSRWRETDCCPPWAARVDARTRVPYVTTLLTGIVVALASLVGDAAETYDLTNIGTLFAFVLVCAGVLVLRVHRARPRRARSGCRSLGRSPRLAPSPACS